MRNLLALVLMVGCTDSSTVKQLLPIGSPCVEDQPTSSVCGTFPTFYCDADHPNGYCKSSCHKDSDCPSGSVCAGAGMVAPGDCHKTCNAPADCRVSEGYVCKTAPDDATHAYCDVPEASMSDGGAD